jgi:hypothetical protein
MIISSARVLHNSILTKDPIIQQQECWNGCTCGYQVHNQNTCSTQFLLPHSSERAAGNTLWRSAQVTSFIYSQISDSFEYVSLEVFLVFGDFYPNSFFYPNTLMAPRCDGMSRLNCCNSLYTTLLLSTYFGLSSSLGSLLVHAFGYFK